MVSMVFLLLIVSVYVSAHINIDIKASEHYYSSRIKYDGYAVGALSPREEKMFQLTQENLKSAVGKLMGKRPDQVFLHEPTPWNLYPQYNWPEVQRILRPVLGRLKTILVQPVELKRDELHNSRTTSVWDVSYVMRNLKNNVSISWNSNGATTALDDISHNVTVDGDFPSQILLWSSWGLRKEHSEILKISPNLFRRVVLKPYEEKEAKVSLTKVTIEFEVRFVTTLQGRVTVNYPGSHKGHHFWGIDIAEIQEKVNLPKKIISKETIKIDFFNDGHIDLE